MASATALAEQITAALTEPLAHLGYDLEAVEVATVGKRRVLRVAVDRDGGITLDDVADATRAVNELLDADNAMGENPYTLEVTSRGVDRPLTHPRHWRRNHDRLVKLTLADGSKLTGRIAEHDEDAGGGVVVEVSGKRRNLAYAEITKATVQVEFNRPKPVADDDEED